MITSKKIGKVRITIQIINENPEAAQLLFTKFIPLRAEIMPQGWIEYMGICEEFEELNEGWAPPLYDFVLRVTESGGIVIDKIEKLRE